MPVISYPERRENPADSARAEHAQVVQFQTSMLKHTLAAKHRIVKQLPGQCSSACVFAYLGGSFRYLSDASNLGVHQFSINDNNLQAGTAIAISQEAAAQIVEFIKKSRVDIQFFTLMTSALPSEIYLFQMIVWNCAW